MSEEVEPTPKTEEPKEKAKTRPRAKAKAEPTDAFDRFLDRAEAVGAGLLVGFGNKVLDGAEQFGTRVLNGADRLLAAIEEGERKPKKKPPEKKAE